MTYLKSLGKWMNEGVEHHHKKSWQLMDHTMRGGAAGNPYAVKLEDGTFEKTPVYIHQHKAMSEALLEEQGRLMYFEFSPAWDATLWAEWGLRKPVEGESLKHQAPQVQAQEAIRRAREALQREKKARAHLDGLDCCTPQSTRERAEHKLHLAQAGTCRAVEKQTRLLAVCKAKGLTGRLTKDAEGNIVSLVLAEVVEKHLNQGEGGDEYMEEEGL